MLEKTLESLLDCKEIKPVSWRKSVLNINWKDWCWSWSSNPLATWCKELTHWKRPRWWERLKAGEEGDDQRWAGWMVSPTQWTWVWASSWSWWWTGNPGVLQSMGSQSWTQLSNWTELRRIWWKTCDIYIYSTLLIVKDSHNRNHFHLSPVTDLRYECSTYWTLLYRFASANHLIIAIVKY